MPIKSYADTSAVSLAYAFSDAADKSEVGTPTLKLVPFTTEGFTMAKEARSSTAITDSRRTSGSKNTQGSASGAMTVEFGATPFCLDMLQAVLMNTWTDLGGGKKAIWDSDIKQYLVIEKTITPNRGAANEQFHENYFGTLINDATLEIGTSELITLALNTISANADYSKAVQGSNGLGGSISSEKLAPANYEIADASNNVKNFTIRDSLGQPLEMTFSSISLAVQNNVREQPGIGHVFAAGIGMGKVGVELSAEAYFYDQTVLEVHMSNERISGETVIETADGKFTIYFPNMIAQSPSSNAGGDNQDYSTSVTLTAEEGEHAGQRCVIYIEYEPKGAVVTGSIDSFTASISGDDLTVSGTTTGVSDGRTVSVQVTDALTGEVTSSTTVASGSFTDTFDVSSLANGDLTVFVTIVDDGGNSLNESDIVDYS